jgi:FKBP-type peptidyl-prolyl cis-trans isomerase 2
MLQCPAWRLVKKKTINIAPEDGYGEKSPDAIIEFQEKCTGRYEIGTRYVFNLKQPGWPSRFRH